MASAPLPSDETLRLLELESYDILDTLEEQEYDDITLLLSNILDTPINLISLVDSKRQWFKSKMGLQIRETPRELAFCAHAILKPESPLVVEDTTKDQRFYDNDLVTGAPGIRFYAGWPLNTPSGYSLGTLCAIDTKPREITESQLRALNVLARNTMTLLELRKTQKRLVATNEALSNANKELSDFTYIVSHDLRSPLVNLKGFSDELERSLAVLSPVFDSGLKTFENSSQNSLRIEYKDMIPEALHFIKSSTNKMDTLTTAILELSRKGHREYILEEVKTEPLVKQSLATLQYQIEQTNSTVTIGELPNVLGDRTALEQIFGNILDNAIKYLTPGRPGQIMIQGKKTQTETTFVIEDNGRGISEEDMKKIFTVFKRAANVNDIKGNGMGMPYVQAMVRRHGGKIWCESKLGAGTRFFITFPTNPHQKIEITPTQKA